MDWWTQTREIKAQVKIGLGRKVAVDSVILAKIDLIAAAGLTPTITTEEITFVTRITVAIAAIVATMAVVAVVIIHVIDSRPITASAGNK